MPRDRRGLTANESTPVVQQATPGAAKPTAQANPSRPWWWYVTPAGWKNERDYRLKQLGIINRQNGYRPAGGLGVPVAGMNNLNITGSGAVTPVSQSQRDIVRGAAQVPLNAVKLGTNVVQRATNGNKPADPASTPVGQVVTATERALNTALDIPQPEQRKPEDLFWQQMGTDFTTGALGAFGGMRLIGANAFTQGAFGSLSPAVQQALRWTAGVGTESFISTALTDNRQGNLANAFGENAPFAVQPTDDMVSSTLKSLLPNAGAEVVIGLGGLVVGKGLNNITRRVREGRVASEQQAARNWAQENGVQVENDGEFEFTPEAQQPAAEAPTAEAPTAEAPTAAPEPAAAPQPEASSQVKTQQDAENVLLGPEEAAPVYDPATPEVDVAIQAIDRLDDERLQIVATGEGPVLPELDRQLGEQQAAFQVEEGLHAGLYAAPSESLANPMVPYEAQWQQLPQNTLLSLAAPQNSPQLFRKIQELTGREFEQFTRGDVIEGLKALQAEGQTVLPNRLLEGGGMDVESIQVDPQRFQFKDNVNAQGQQAGNSLEGVSKWNTDAEGVIQVWDDPDDGVTYVVNGHNRLAKAKELGIPTIRTEQLLAPKAELAKAQGAISNIADGKGTAFDAAKVIKELGIQDPAGLEAVGIPLQSGLGVQGLALSKLPDNLFQAAINGELPLGRALALGSSGMDPEGMIRVYQLSQGRDMTERGFSELTQMASTAPKVESDQMGLFGPETIDTTIIKAELAAKVRAELTSNKNLFKKVGRNKNATKLADKGGTQVDQAQVQDAAGVAEAVLGEFDQTKYAAETPISQLLNEGAAEIAAGAKPAVVAKRILAQMEKAAEVAPPTPKAPVEEPAAAPVETEPGPLLPEQRNELKKQAITRAIQSGEVRPSAAPLPELPDGPRDLADPQATLADELRLAEHYAQQDAIAQQVELEAQRAAIGYDAMPLEEKKANGMLDSWQKEDPKRFFHGAAGEFKLEEGGEFGGDGMNIYGDGLYSTDNLGIAGSYQKKNKSKGTTINGVTYEVVEKAPVKFFDLDKPASSAVLDKLRGSAGYDAMRELVDTAIDELDGTPSLAEVFDEMRGYSREFDIPAYELQEMWFDFTQKLEKDGYGGFTHQGGKLAGRGKNLHQVRIYWDPANSVDIYKVDADGKRVTAAAPSGIEIPAGASRKITARTDESRIEVAAQSLQNWAGDVAGEAMSMDEAMGLVRSKGAILDPDKIPGLDMEAARSDKTKGVRETPATQAVAQAYREFYGVEQAAPGAGPAELSSIAQERYAIREFGLGPTPAYMQDELQQIVRDAVARIAGEDATVALHGAVKLIERPEAWGGGGKMSKQYGSYELVEDIVNVRGLLDSPADQVISTAYHESFHRIQFALMTQADMDVFDSVFGKTRIENYTGARRQIATIERQAVAFQKFAEMRAQGITGAEDVAQRFRYEVIDALDENFPRKNGESWYGTFTERAATTAFRVFDRVMEFLERVNNGIRGRGFTSVEDFYNKAFSGEIARKRAVDYALEAITPDQKAREARLRTWVKDNKAALSDIGQAVAGIDDQINALKAQAIAGGC